MTLDSTNQVVAQGATTASGPGWRVAARLVGMVALQVLLLFVAAGRLDWGRGWIFLAVALVVTTANMLLVLRLNPELIAERWQKRSDTKGFDRVFMVLYVPVVVGVLVVAGLDAGRFGWSAPPAALLGLGLGLYLLGDVPVAWAMATNPHLEATVRIQVDRGHRVITSGPYHFVRHPMYVGGLLTIGAWPLILGSYWAFVPVAVIVVLFVGRTALEDRTLQRELPGYADYARTTRFRLIPGLW